MTKFLSIAVAATVAVLSAGFMPLSAGTAEAKTANQVKQENRAKQTVARNNAKRAAARSKSRK